MTNPQQLAHINALTYYSVEPLLHQGSWDDDSGPSLAGGELNN